MLYLLSIINIASAKSAASYIHRPGIVTIAHRGACGYLPEHTIASYKLAAEMGADYIEIDLIPTKDNHFISHHDHSLNHTSDIHSHENRSTFQNSTGDHSSTDNLINEFLLEDLKKLKLRQTNKDRDQSHNWIYQILTFDEILKWAIEENKARALKGEKLVGLYIELKLPRLFNGIGFSIEEDFLRVLSSYDLDTAAKAAVKCPIVIQCFEFDTIEKLSKITDLPLTYLLWAPEIEKTVAEAHSYVDIIGADIDLLYDENFKSSGLIAEIHSFGLDAHVWGLEIKNLPYEELYKQLKNEGIDGIFTEYPDLAHTYLSN